MCWWQDAERIIKAGSAPYSITFVAPPPSTKKNGKKNKKKDKKKGKGKTVAAGPPPDGERDTSVHHRAPPPPPFCLRYRWADRHRPSAGPGALLSLVSWSGGVRLLSCATAAVAADQQGCGAVHRRSGRGYRGGAVG